MPLLDLEAVPGVESDGREVRVHFLVSVAVDGHGGTEISVGVPGHHCWHPLTLVTTPVVSILAKKTEPLRNFAADTVSSYLVVLVELHDRAVAATAPAVQVELELDMKYRTYGGDNLVHILSRYPDICKRTVVVSVLSYSDIFLLTIFRLTLDYVLVDDSH